MYTEMVSQEKRRYPRVYQTILARVALEDEVYPAVCKNISEGGVFVEFNSPAQNLSYRLRKNIWLNLALYGLNGTTEVKAPTRIRWKREDITPAGGKIGLGLEFIQLKDEDQGLISNFVKTRLIPPQELPPIKEYKLLIGGEELKTEDYRYFPYTTKLITEPIKTKKILEQLRTNPISVSAEYPQYVYCRYYIANTHLNYQAIEWAKYASKIFANFPLERRVKIICDIHQMLLKERETLLNLFEIEGHPRRLGEWELGGMLKGTEPKTVEYYKTQLHQFLGRDGDQEVYISRRPDGVVCLNTPKNAPSSISVIGVFALLAGNAMIIKPPFAYPVSTIFFWKDIVWKALKKNGAPDGTVNILVGNSSSIMEEWLNSPHVSSIIYIGDSKKGLEIGKKIFSAGKKPILELSGNDLCILWKDAPVEEATDTLLESFYGSTQICMVPKVGIIHTSIYPAVKQKLLEDVKKLKPGLPSDPETVLTPVGKIREFYIALEDILKKGGRLLYGGRRLNYTGESDPNGVFIEPTIVEIEESPYLKNIKCIQEEIFFPLLPLVIVNGVSDEEIFAKIIEITNSHNYGLRISLWIRSKRIMDRFIQQIRNTGILRINSSHIGFTSFLSGNGGTRFSGGPFGEMSYIWQKTSHLQGITVKNIH